MKKSLRCVACAMVLLLPISVFAKAGAKKAAQNEEQETAKAGGLTKELAEAYFQRMFGYDSSIVVKVLKIEPSAVEGLSEMMVVFITPEGQQLGRWYVSQDLRHAIVGQVLPFGAHPFAPVRAKLAKEAFGPTKGPADAKLLIVEFGDLECPACREAQPVMDRLQGEFPQAKFIFQSFPLAQHPWALTAAGYLDCIARANQQQSFPFIDSIYNHQKEIEDAVRKTDAEGKTTVDDAAVAAQLKHYAEEAGVDPAKIAACAATTETAERLEKSQELGREVEVNSTPTLFVNGRKVTGIRAEQYDALKRLVTFEEQEAAKGN